MKKKQINDKINESSIAIKIDREVLREPGRISFKGAMKKMVNSKPKKK